MKLHEAPRVLQQMSLFIAGKGVVGNVNELSLPALAWNTISSKGAIEASFNAGTIKEMECSFKINQLKRESFGAVALGLTGTSVEYRFNGSVHVSGSASAKSAKVIIHGDVSDINFGTWSASAELVDEYKIKVHYFAYEIDGFDLVEVNALSGLVKINGVDVTKSLRENLLK